MKFAPIRIISDSQRLYLQQIAPTIPAGFVVRITQDRSTKQNRLQRQWCNDVAAQLGDVSAEWARGYSKLHFGVPILRRTDDEFRVKYDQHVKPLVYESKLACMMEPIDMPVTRRMSKEAKTEYLDEMARHWSAQGVRLTDPEDMR
ncbi:hypothetical protein Q0601_00730 [Paracoccus onubensis]|uniref:hypothetical protein n=1 Tax=Paracoccus onubensis TaxID=1675788 RepID=UPI002731E3D5|nr:hypothetical protein [Paracoccus onubensis]MDP0925686.1 hypothetical protein [Paracoccus onubensis]